MKQNKFLVTLSVIKFWLFCHLLLIKAKLFPAKKIAISKDYMMECYSRLNSALNREDLIFNEIDRLKANVESHKDTCFQELADFDFELFKVRFHGDFECLQASVGSCRSYIFRDNDTELTTIYIYPSFLKGIKFDETELNKKIEIMRKIRDFLEVPKEQVSLKQRREFKRQIKRSYPY